MRSIITATRYHDISCGHRVVGHENKCRHLHGHNYRIWFECEQEPPMMTTRADITGRYPADDFRYPLPSYPCGGKDEIGRVIDFGVIKSKLCDWVETFWDHKTLLWNSDPLWNWFAAHRLKQPEAEGAVLAAYAEMQESFISVPFNPTAENMAQYLVHIVGPQELRGTGVYLKSVRVDETRKCSATSIRRF
jgi:6-pyruvoyltetrahydropterin/6-carboxytetrahydropterin synthase